MPVVQSAVRVHRRAGSSGAVLPPQLPSARLRGAPSQPGARACGIRRRDRATRARAPGRPRLRAAVRNRRRRAGSGVARREGVGQRPSGSVGLAARRRSPTLGLPPRMIVMSTGMSTESAQTRCESAKARSATSPSSHHSAMHDSVEQPWRSTRAGVVVSRMLTRAWPQVGQCSWGRGRSAVMCCRSAEIMAG